MPALIRVLISWLKGLRRALYIKSKPCSKGFSGLCNAPLKKCDYSQWHSWLENFLMHLDCSKGSGPLGGIDQSQPWHHRAVHVKPQQAMTLKGCHEKPDGIEQHCRTAWPLRWADYVSQLCGELFKCVVTESHSTSIFWINVFCGASKCIIMSIFSKHNYAERISYAMG